MKSILFAILAGLTVVSAMPPSYSNLEERQGDTTSNDLKDGPCKAVTFIMARGSTEVGNMVSQQNLCAIFMANPPGHFPQAHLVSFAG